MPGYDPTMSVRKTSRRNSRRNSRTKMRHRRSINNVASINFANKDDIFFTYRNLDWTGPTSASLSPHQEDSRVERAEILYRVTKGINELIICELETYYVRRYNKFPFFVKSVTCQENKSIQHTKITCNRRYEKGHILRLEKMSHCYQKKEESTLKWIHDWETRVVGCDAVLPLDVK